MSHPTPVQVLARRRELLLAQDTEGFIDLFAPDAVIELPFSGPDLPGRLEGQQAIREFSKRAAASPMRIEGMDETAIYQTDDPEVVIVELAAQVAVATTGQQISTTSVQVFRIRDGKILLFRDYFNPLGLAELLG
jgi:uncharacterized protein